MSENPFSKYAEYLSLGAEIAAAIAFPILIGYGLDIYFETSPWLILAGCLVGIVNVMIVIFKIAGRIGKQE